MLRSRPAVLRQPRNGPFDVGIDVSERTERTVDKFTRSVKSALVGISITAILLVSVYAVASAVSRR